MTKRKTRTSEQVRITAAPDSGFLVEIEDKYGDFELVAAADDLTRVYDILNALFSFDKNAFEMLIRG